MNLTRKEFLRSVLGTAAGVAGAAVVIGCGGGDEGGADAAGRSCSANGTSVDIGGNHSHTMTVSRADVMAGASKTYNIEGGGGHPHSVTINATLFTMLQSNATVTVLSTAGSTDGHTHSITVSCL
jgi:hypothetical protein